MGSGNQEILTFTFDLCLRPGIFYSLVKDQGGDQMRINLLILSKELDFIEIKEIL